MLLKYANSALAMKKKLWAALGRGEEGPLRAS